MIPFDHKILDVRIAGPSKVTLKVSTVQGVVLLFTLITLVKYHTLGSTF